MASKIYNIDDEKEVTPILVRDAIEECFFKAHCLDSGIKQDDKEVGRDYCNEIVKKGFNETSGDYYNPTKESIMKVLEYLSEFSKNFRDPEIVKKHFNEILTLVNKLK